jgi:hypothetical protein
MENKDIEIKIVDECLDALKMIRHKQVRAAIEHLIMYKQEREKKK